MSDAAAKTLVGLTLLPSDMADLQRMATPVEGRPPAHAVNLYEDANVPDGCYIAHYSDGSIECKRLGDTNAG